ncbi:MAG: DeoR/GlpR transcriptional regulator [Bryobacterales bacterium]|nr:DeoR/GlpR transcriptional regulator [Bryobacterales bacterium]
MAAAPKRPKLLLEERRRAIVEMVEARGRIMIADLVEHFGISAVTARADLDALSGTEAVVRCHGGAVRALEPTRDYPVTFKASIHRPEKLRIGQAAAKLVRAGETIILDSGTTTLEIARRLKTMGLRGVTVITNALNIAAELAGDSGVTLIMVGGIYRQISSSFVGPQAEAMLHELHADRFFLAVDGLDTEFGPTTPDILEAQLNGRMMEVAKETIVVSDSSKLGRRSLSRIGPIEKVARVITDKRASEDCVRQLRAKGVEVILA